MQRRSLCRHTWRVTARDASSFQQFHLAAEWLFQMTYSTRGIQLENEGRQTATVPGRMDVKAFRDEQK